MVSPDSIVSLVGGSALIKRVRMATLESLSS
jgi:hypothetical protein